jgi:hypothetical protein
MRNMGRRFDQVDPDGAAAAVARLLGVPVGALWAMELSTFRRRLADCLVYGDDDDTRTAAAVLGWALTYNGPNALVDLDRAGPQLLRGRWRIGKSGGQLAGPQASRRKTDPRTA